MIGKLNQFSYETELSGAASAKAVIETSEDGKTVKESKEVVLRNGKGTQDLSDLGSAKFVRVSTAMQSSVTEAATDVPVIRSYTVNAGNCNTWATLADWNKGVFTGAAGYESDDIFNDYANDYDDYSGTADVSKIAVGSDMAQNHWAYQNVQALAAKGVVSGDAGTGFVRPNDRITREEVATALLKALDIPVDQTGTIAAGDRSSAWAKDILASAKARGILLGDAKGNMNGQLTATRAEVAAMIARVAGLSETNASGLEKFSDHASIPAWARGSLAGLIENGMLSGYQDNTLRASAQITRAEAFTMIAKLL